MALQDATNPMQGVSGPGQYSKRTDLEYQAPEYGDGKAMAEQIAGAPLAKSEPVRGARGSDVKAAAASAAAQQPAQAPVGLYDLSQRPEEPVTHGVDIGPGAGSHILNLPDPAQAQYTTAYQMINQWAQHPNASPTLTYLAQRIKQGF